MIKIAFLSPTVLRQLSFDFPSDSHSDRRRRLHFSLIRELEIATVDDQKRQSVPLTLISFNLFGRITAYQQHMLNRNITGYEAPRNSPRGHLKRVPPNNDRGIDLWGLNSICEWRNRILVLCSESGFQFLCSAFRRAEILRRNALITRAKSLSKFIYGILS